MILREQKKFIKKESNGFSEIIYKSGDLVYQNKKNLPILLVEKIKSKKWDIELN